MKKRELREKAKDIIQDALAIAYYKVADGNTDIPEEYHEAVIQEMNKICSSMCKHIGREHYTF